MNQTIIGAGPYHIDVQRRGRNGINHAALGRLSVWLRAVFTDCFGDFKGLARQVGTDLLPTTAAIASLPKSVRGKKHRTRIQRRENDRLCSDDAKVSTAKRLRHDVLRLRCSSIVTRQLTAIDDVRIERIRNDVTVFFR